MKKPLTALTVALSLLIPTNAIASVKAGSVCAKLNATTSVSGYKYTCIKSGKKLVWSKGVRVVVATPTPTPTPIAPSPIAPSPIAPTPIAPTSFEDLQSHLDGIIYGAWSKAAQKIQGSVSVLGNVQILVGPNTKEDDPNSLLALNLASKLYSNLNQVKTLYVIKFSLPDVAWAQQQYDLFHAINNYPTGVADACNFLYCNGATAGTNNNGDGIIIAGQGDRYSIRHSSGQVVAHEYAHTIQMLRAPCQGQLCWGDAPPWLREGGAEWSGTASRFSGNFDDYLAIRKSSLATDYALSYKYTADYMTRFLNPNPYLSPTQFDWHYWDKYDAQTSYSIGFMVNEILVNVKSPEAVLRMYSDIGAGKSFIEAFQQEFGMAWADACPIIAKAIASEIELGIQR